MQAVNALGRDAVASGTITYLVHRTRTPTRTRRSLLPRRHGRAVVLRIDAAAMHAGFLSLQGHIHDPTLRHGGDKQPLCSRGQIRGACDGRG